MKQTLQRVLAKLEQVRNRGLTSFGSNTHKFRLNPPITETAVQKFERKHRIDLPEDYRAFLTLAGNGGAGPFYGLLPLERWGDAVIEDIPDYLAMPSPLRPHIPENVEWETALGCAFEELFQDTLALVHQGCAYYALLIVSGFHRGKVVYVDLDRCGTPYFVQDKTFIAWYERWLDELLWGYDGSWFGTGLPGREEDMVAALNAQTSEAEVREEALNTLMRIPALHRTTLAVIQRSLHDPVPRVRAQATYLLGKHGVTEAASAIEVLARDTESIVRKVAISVLGKLPGVPWESIVRTAMGDANREVVFLALRLLKDAKCLKRADIDAMLQSEDPLVRRDALWASDTVVEGSGSVEIADIHFLDSHKEVRRYAILAAGSRKDRRKTPVLLGLLRQEKDVQLLSCVVSALGSIGDPDAVPALIDMTCHTDGFVRQDTARALGKLGDVRAIPALEALLDDATEPVRRDEHGITQMSSTRSVADEARGALARLRQPWYRRWF